MVAPSEQRIQYFEHLAEDLLRGTTAERYGAYATGRQWGWLTINEIRTKENLPTIGAEGDAFLVPGNMLNAETLLTALAQPPVKTPTMAPAQMPSQTPNGNRD